MGKTINMVGGGLVAFLTLWGISMCGGGGDTTSNNVTVVNPSEGNLHYSSENYGYVQLGPELGNGYTTFYVYDTNQKLTCSGQIPTQAAKDYFNDWDVNPEHDPIKDPDGKVQIFQSHMPAKMCGYLWKPGQQSGELLDPVSGITYELTWDTNS